MTITATAATEPTTIFLIGDGFSGDAGMVFSGSCSGSSSASFSKSVMSDLLPAMLLGSSETADWTGCAVPSNFSDSVGTVDGCSAPGIVVSNSGETTAVEGSSSIAGKVSEGIHQSSSITSLRNKSFGSFPGCGKALSLAAISSPFHGQQATHYLCRYIPTDIFQSASSTGRPA